MSKIYPHINIQQLHSWHLLTGNVPQISQKEIKPWKVMHAELLSAIWYARNQRIFDENVVHPNEIISLTKLRALRTIQVFHHVLQISHSRNKRQRKKRNKTVDSKSFLVHFELQNDYGIFGCFRHRIDRLTLVF